MGFWDDIGNNISNLFKNNPNALDPNAPPTTTGGDPATGDFGGAGGDFAPGSADASSSGSSGSGDWGGAGGSFPGGPPTTSPAASPSRPPISQTMLDAFLSQASTPAMNQDNLQRVTAGLNGLQVPDYLGMAKNAYQNTVGQIQGIQQGVNDRYGQVKDFLGDMYGINQNAMQLGNNNVLTNIAKDEGNAIQGNAQTAVNTIAQMKNSQLSTLANALQASGRNPADAATMGDRRIDPTQVQVAGITANAAQAANNANAAATDRTQLNNDMAAALGNQGNVMQQQLLNQQLNYNAGMGKYLADLANQEATREMEAQKESYAAQMNRIMAGYNMDKDQATLNIEKAKALYGNKGLLSGLQDVGTYNLDNARAAQMAGGGNRTPVEQALAQYPQFSDFYGPAMAQFAQHNPGGTRMTAGDLLNAMQQGGAQGNSNDLADFANIATSSKVPMGGYNMNDIASLINGQ